MELVRSFVEIWLSKKKKITLIKNGKKNGPWANREKLKRGHAKRRKR